MHVRGVARGGLNRRNQNGVATRCEPGQRFKAALTPRKGRPQTVGFGMVPYLCRCDDIICAINQPNLLDNHAYGCLNLTCIRISPNLSSHA